MAADAGSLTQCVLDNDTGETWKTAIMKPKGTSGKGVYSFQLIFYNKLDQAVQSTFKVNDITIVYRMKKKK